MKTKTVLSRNLNTLSHKTAKEFVILAGKAIRKKGFCTVVLSGGETPRKFYETLASKRFRSQIDWKQVYFFFGDERCVSLASQLSNYRMVRETLFSKVPIPKENIFRIKGELQPAVAAEEYERLAKKYFKKINTLTLTLSRRGRGNLGHSIPLAPLWERDGVRGVSFPIFDLVLLGVGKDGHIASLFPQSKTLKEKKRWVVPVYEKTAIPPHRITMTLPVINNAKNVWFLVTGTEKRSILKKVLQKGRQYPAQLVKSERGQLTWFADKQAFPEKL
jgi:6-phosphogluconolactonase